MNLKTKWNVYERNILCGMCYMNISETRKQNPILLAVQMCAFVVYYEYVEWDERWFALYLAPYYF